MSSSPPDLITTARQLMQQGQEYRALDLLRRAIQQKAPLGERWGEVLQLVEQLGDEDGAVEAARQYGASAPGDPRRALAYVEKLSRVGDTALAARLAEQLRAQRPNDPAIHYVQGLLASRMGDFERAEASLRQALQLKPDLADAWVQIGAFRNFADHAR